MSARNTRRYLCLLRSANWSVKTLNPGAHLEQKAILSFISSVSSRSARTIARLQELGFGAEDCARALDATGGRLDEAAAWLTQFAELRAGAASPTHAEADSDKDGFKISGFEVCLSVVTDFNFEPQTRKKQWM